MNITISKTGTPEDITVVARPARRIWQQHFTAIIGANQVEYMLTKFQSFEAIAEQIRSGAQYYLHREKG